VLFGPARGLCGQLHQAQREAGDGNESGLRDATLGGQFDAPWTIAMAILIAGIGISQACFDDNRVIAQQAPATGDDLRQAIDDAGGMGIGRQGA
jgi:hypothetical protein